MPSRSLRWNFRLGPLQFTSPVGAAGMSFLVALVLCCCGAGVLGTLTDDDDPPPPPTPLVETSAPASEPADTGAPATSSAPQVVTAGAFCDRAGATGVTKAGTPMVCTGPGDLRWRRR